METNQRRNEEYEEIDLRNIIQVLLKSKKMIFWVILFSVVAAAAASFLIPRVLRVNAIVEVGSLANADAYLNGGEPVLLQTKDKIDKGVYGASVQQKLWLPAVKTANTAGTNIINLSAESNDSEKAKKYLKEICDEILAEHKKKNDNVRLFLENKISTTQEELSKLRVLDSQRRAGDSGYYLQIVEMERQIDSSQSLLSQVRDTSIIKMPDVEPGKSKIILNVALAAVLGLFIGMFAALAVDWWKKS